MLKFDSILDTRVYTTAPLHSQSLLTLPALCFILALLFFRCFLTKLSLLNEERILLLRPWPQYDFVSLTFPWCVLYESLGGAAAGAYDHDLGSLP